MTWNNDRRRNQPTGDCHGTSCLAMTGWWTDCGRKTANATVFGQKRLSVSLCQQRQSGCQDRPPSLEGKCMLHLRRCVPGGVWGGGFDCGSNQLKPSPAGFFGIFLAGTRKIPSGGTAPTISLKCVVFDAKARHNNCHCKGTDCHASLRTGSQ